MIQEFTAAWMLMNVVGMFLALGFDLNWLAYVFLVLMAVGMITLIIYVIYTGTITT